MSKLKLTYCHPAVFPGPQANTVHVIKMCSALSRAGINVQLIGFRSWKRAFKTRRQLLSYYGCQDSFEIDLVWNLGGLLGRGASIGALLKQAEGHQSSRGIIYTRDIRIAHHFAQNGSDTVLELHHPPHTVDVVLRELLAMPCLRAIVVITSSLREEITRRYAPDIEIVVLPDGADVPASRLEESSHKQHSSPITIGYCGGLYPGKGADLVCELARLRPHIRFVVLGGSRSDANALRGKYSDCRNLAVHARIPHGEVSAWLARFDICLLPNQSSVRISRELDIGPWTSPLKMFEYMAAGKPIIASDLPVLREILKPGRNALLCAPTEIMSWAEAVDRLARDGEMRAVMGSTNLRDLSEKFSWNVRAEKLATILTRSLESPTEVD